MLVAGLNSFFFRTIQKLKASNLRSIQVKKTRNLMISFGTLEPELQM